MRSDHDQLSRLASQDALERRAKFLKGVVDGGNNHGDILVGEGRLVWNGLGLVAPMADAMNQKPEIAMNPSKMLDLVLLS
jgi:hypothetical protein